MTEYMTLKTAMKYLEISNYSTLREYIKQGLPVIKIGRSKRISKTALDEFMKEHQTSTVKTESESVKKGA
ncbi:helix-turn-helix domain-containing protein [Limosilactobacillus mucosae]|uniref:helix-turn-helix domain-containing protein n=1 Tax=Limosilactobacillus mucosae TaxID=97478 RepID=UPI00233EA400|nr:helix-turn-helix domain-containing protein [Limosilactobacillus mucosae]MDC2844544.1 helix-turn-helix domain-containing protein [Limosilactobacillus mucosae]MDC2850005.1 helix-turn-helix domain-containing protein [Limosilactobacillus mucosae]